MKVWMKSIDDIDYEIRQEKHKGIHSYHYCEYCDRKNLCRRNACVQCWEELKNEMKLNV